MMRQARELEFKVQLSKADFDKIIRSLKTGQKEVSTRKLRTIYYDTLQFDLFAAGLSLRLRQEKDHWIQTVKAEQGLKNGLSNPIELEAAVKEDVPELGVVSDQAYAKKVRKIIGQSPLKPAFETVIQRTSRRVKVNGAEIEIALDVGEVRTDKSRLRIREAELELKHGSAEALLVAAVQLFDGRRLSPSNLTKSGLGYELIGAKKPDQKPFQAAEIGPKTSCREAFSTLIDQATHQIIDNRRVVIESDDTRGPHHMRIGLRRLRSLLKALRLKADTPSLRKFDAMARDIARSIGELRDADAMIGAIYTPVATTIDARIDLSALNRALREYREAMQHNIRSMLQSPGWSHLQLYLSLWPRTLEANEELNQPLAGFAHELLEQRWKKLRKRGRNLAEMSVEQRHDMRKALKHFRYLSEFFAPAFQKDTSKFVKRLKELQDVFGYMNDVHMAGKLPDLLKKLGGGEAKFAAQYVLGWHASEARHVWERAGIAWKQLREAPRFWT
jgi:triphosphatase